MPSCNQDESIVNSNNNNNNNKVNNTIPSINNKLMNGSNDDMAAMTTTTSQQHNNLRHQSCPSPNGTASPRHKKRTMGSVSMVGGDTNNTTTTTNNNNNSMLGDGYLVMREQDADLLESIQLLDSDSLIPTPIISGQSVHSTDSHTIIPPLSIADDASSSYYPNGSATENGEKTKATAAAAAAASNSTIKPVTPMRRALSGEVWTTTEEYPPLRGDYSMEVTGTDNKPVSPLRRALSGEVWSANDVPVQEYQIPYLPVVDNNNQVMQDDSVKKKTTYMRSDLESDSATTHSVLQSAVSASRMRRTESKERRMCEAVQFAEAVGEDVLAPEYTSMIQIIDDDDNDDVFDYDDNENENDRNIYEEEDDDDGYEVPVLGKQQVHLDQVNEQQQKTQQQLHENKNTQDTTQLLVQQRRSDNHHHHDTTIRRTDSTERRIKEAAQFAEAVGEFDVALQDDPTSSIRIIDDDQDYYYDDQQSRDYDIEDEDHNQSTNQEQQTADHQPKSKNHLFQPIINIHEEQRTTTPVADIVNNNGSQLQRHHIARTYSTPSAIHSSTDDMAVYKPSTSRKLASSFRHHSHGFLDKLPDDYNSAPATSKQLDFVYKGIQSNPPEIVKRGTTRGNYAQLHRKAWLEVSDKYHRYGKNLRLYYRYWESLGFPTNMFFDWLDSKGEAAGQPLPELEECPRVKLDSDTVLYITNPQVTQSYAIDFIPVTTTTDDTSSLAQPFINSNTETTTKTEETHQNHSHHHQSQLRRCLVLDSKGKPLRTGPDGWIFVLRDNEMYGAPKVTSVTTPIGGGGGSSSSSHHKQQRFHHSSFFGGKAVAAAGIFLTDDDGILLRLYPHSGHYRPGEAHMQRVLFYLYHKGVDLRSFEMDIQQILHIARDTPTKPPKDKQSKQQQQPKDKLQQQDDQKNNNMCCINTNDENHDGNIGNKKTCDSCTADVNDDAAGDIQNGANNKKKKIESLHLMPAIMVACFLAHKARFIGEGIFAQIHKIRKRGTEITTVTEALNIIDDGGCFKSSSWNNINNKIASCNHLNNSSSGLVLSLDNK